MEEPAARGDGQVDTAAGALAAERLFGDLYHELHRLARRQLRSRAAGGTLSATALLHEAYVELAHSRARFPDRARFFAYVSRAMRGVIIDHVRERRALKRGGEFHLTTLDTHVADSVPELAEMTRLSDALDELAHMDAGLATLVDLKFFCGLSFGEIAELRGVSERTVQRDWSKARLVLHDMLSEG